MPRQRERRSHRDAHGRAKVGWVVPGPALAAARRLARAQGWPVDVYTCRACESYHLGKGRDSAVVPPGVARAWPTGAVIGTVVPL
mgnify:CR=1 FL=1